MAAALVVALGGCAASPDPPATVTQTAAPARLAMPAADVVVFDRSRDGRPGPARFEFARRNAALGASARVPLLATNQWPAPARPVERRIIFRRWVQR